jgi:hypothetical protein
MRIPVRSIAGLVFDEMWHPFYCFQYFSVIIWVAGDQYYTYAGGAARSSGRRAISARQHHDSHHDSRRHLHLSPAPFSLSSVKRQRIAMSCLAPPLTPR